MFGRRLIRESRELGLLIRHLVPPRTTSPWASGRSERSWRYNLVEHNGSTVIAGLLEICSGIKPSFVSSVRIDDHSTNSHHRIQQHAYPSGFAPRHEK
jgi:hypothetical protein